MSVIVQFSWVQIAVTAVKASADVRATRNVPLGVWTSAARHAGEGRVGGDGHGDGAAGRHAAHPLQGGARRDPLVPVGEEAPPPPQA